MSVFCGLPVAYLPGEGQTVTMVPQAVISVGNDILPHLPQVRGGTSEQEQQERMHVTERQ